MRSLLFVHSTAAFLIISFWMNSGILSAELETAPSVLTSRSTAVTETTSTHKHTPATGRRLTTSSTSDRIEFVVPFVPSRSTFLFTPPSLILVPRTVVPAGQFGQLEGSSSNNMAVTVVPVREFPYETGRTDNTDVTTAMTNSAESDTTSAAADNTAATFIIVNEVNPESTSAPDTTDTSSFEPSTSFPSDTTSTSTVWAPSTSSIDPEWTSSTLDNSNGDTDSTDWTGSATEYPDSSGTGSYYSAHALRKERTSQLWREFLRRDQYELPNAFHRLMQIFADLLGSMLEWTYADPEDLRVAMYYVGRAADTIPASLLTEMEIINSTCTYLLMVPRMIANWIPHLTLTNMQSGYVSNPQGYYEARHDSDNYTLIGFTNRTSVVEFQMNAAVDILVFPTPGSRVEITTENTLLESREKAELRVRVPRSLLRWLNDTYWPQKSDVPQRYTRSDDLPEYDSQYSWFHPKIWIEVARENSLHRATLQRLRNPTAPEYKNISIVSRIVTLSTTTDNQFQQFFRLPDEGQPINLLSQVPVTIDIYGVPSASNSMGIPYRYMCGHYDSSSLGWDLQVGCKGSEGGVTTQATFNASITEFTCCYYTFGSFALFRVDGYHVAEALNTTLRNLRRLYTEGHSVRIPEELHLLVFQLDTANSTETDQSALQLILDIFQFANVIQSTSIAQMQNQHGICNQLMQFRDIIARNIVFRTNHSNETMSASTNDFSIMVTRLSAVSRFTGIEAYFESTGLHKIKENGYSDGNGSMGSSIVFPDSLIDHLINVSAHTEVRVWFEVSRNSSIYNATVSSLDSSITTSPNDTRKNFELASWVTGASFSADISTPNWTDSVTIRAKILQFQAGLTYTCAYWDIYGNNGLGSWSSKGCKNGGINDTYMTCYCTHLTSFGILVDVSGLIGISEEARKILSAGTFAALIISIIALFIVIAMIILTRTPHRDSGKKHFTENDFVLLNLCSALILTYVTFMAGIDRLEPKDLCITTGVFLHWFFLVSFAWLVVEGWLLFKTFAMGKMPLPTLHFKLRSVFPCWVLPFAIVCINLIIDKRVYGYGLVKSCWLDSVYASVQFYLTVILPICLTLAWNFTVFVLIIKHLICAKKTIRSTKADTDLLTHLRRCVIFSVLLGLPWILILIDISNSGSMASLTMNAFIVIFCGFQGVGILIVQAYGTKGTLKRMSKSFWQSRHNVTSTKSTSLQSADTSHVKSSKTM